MDSNLFNHVDAADNQLAIDSVNSEKCRDNNSESTTSTNPEHSNSTL